MKPGLGGRRRREARETGSAAETETEREEKRQVAAWRFGPAQYWYDQANVPADGSGFQYGFKLRKEGAPEWPPPSTHPPQHFLPINLENWEEKVIWDGKAVREKLIAKLASGEQPFCGWIPTQYTRTYETFMAALKGGLFPLLLSENPPSQELAQTMIRDAMAKHNFVREPGPNASIFPPENVQLMQTRWEENIIWDPENMSRLPEPRILELDVRQEPRLLGMPDDGPPERGTMEESPGRSEAAGPSGPGGKDFVRKDHQFTRKSQLLLGQVERRKRAEEEEAEEEERKASSLDPFNLSNDQFYQPKATPRQLSSGHGAASLQHSLPAVNIHRAFFPTHLSVHKLRHFYRPPLRKGKGAVGKPEKDHSVCSLLTQVAAKAREREAQRAAMGGGDVFFMRKAADLSARDGEVVLWEYSEEHPPLMSQPGMATKIRNYYKRKMGKEAGAPSWEYGETAFSHTSPFLGSLAPGEALQAVENNLFRAPAFRHSSARTDFLLVRSRKGFFLRQIPAVYTVAQLCPLYEVPSPSSKRAANFQRDFLLAHVYRLFWREGSAQEGRPEGRPDAAPRQIRMEEVREAFPQYPESSIRKRLKLCADYRRTGSGGGGGMGRGQGVGGRGQQEWGVWTLRGDFRLPSREEVEALVSPELCCAAYSMWVAEQRLKDAGYGEKYFFTPENDDADESVSMEDEIKCAPWNTTRAYIAAVKGKCLLDQSGVADPTGHGLGFSYVKVSNKPARLAKEEREVGPKKLVTGTDADLRKLSLKEAKEMLRKFNIKEEDIAGLSRWEIIDVIRTISTQRAREDAGGSSGIAKFARGNIRMNLSELQDKYRQYCQRTFQQQNRRLASDEVLSTDEGSSDGDSDLDEMEAHVHEVLSGKAPTDHEAKEKEELVAMLKSTDSQPSTATSANLKTPATARSQQATKLKIYRTYLGEDGQEYTKTEEVARSQLIDAYMKLRSTKDEAFIKHFAQMDEEFKEEQRRERRRAVDAARRLKRGVDDRPQPSSVSPQPPPKKPPPPIKPHLAKMTCSACGGLGHMKTNKMCPLYGKSPAKTLTECGSTSSASLSSPAPVNIAPTDEELDAQMVVPEGTLVSVDESGTKLRFNKALVQEAQRIQKQSLKLTFPKALIGDVKANRRSSTASGTVSEAEELVLSAPKQTVQRRRTDPRIVMASVLEKVLSELREMEGSHYFLEPVSAKKVVDYYQIVKQPMDLRKMREKVAEGAYSTRAEFLSDVQLILSNSRLYNGDADEITGVAKRVVELAARRVTEKEEKLMRLEKAINPLLDDNDLVAFSFHLSQILERCKAVPKSFAFHRPVDGKKFKHYYDKITCPMDLGTMEAKLKKQTYTTVEGFRKDLEQVAENSRIFNGPTNVFTVKAQEILSIGLAGLAEESESLTGLERNIQRALEAAETESLITGTSSVAGDLEETELRDETEEAELRGEMRELGEMGEVREMGEMGEMGEEEELEEVMEDYDPVSELMGSIARSGQLNADLAMSDSDDDDANAAADPANIQQNFDDL